jgi:hypothetical protein
LTIYREVKQRIFRENRQAKVIFLECPFLSVYRWNKHQGREYNTQTEEIEKKQDTELKSITKYFNDQLQLINRDWTTPKISQDQIILSKKKRISYANYKVNYNLLFDGNTSKKTDSETLVTSISKIRKGPKINWTQNLHK